MIGFTEIDTVPAAETCIQVGVENYMEISRKEAGVYLIENELPQT